MTSSNNNKSQEQIKSKQFSFKYEEIQEYINEKYPKNGVCKRDSDKENKNKNRREEIIKLDLSKGTVGRSGNKNLGGSLKLEGFANLEVLKCSSQRITNLDVSECSKLKKLDCSSNQITSLSVKGLTKLEEINCYDNKISKLDLSDNTELKNLKCHKNLLEEITGLERLKELTAFVSSPFSPISGLEEDINKVKKFLDKYKELMSKERNAYQRIMVAEIDSKKVFSQEEIDQSRLEVDKYQAQIEQVDNLINKW